MNPVVLDELRQAGLVRLEAGSSLTEKGHRWLDALTIAAEEIPSEVPASAAGLISSTFALDR
ncbi:MAG: hypothetical protein QOH90_657 [Actinomycetota bacterium]|nr:hypothetical protein [Actinomycetota bacterium]